MTELWRRIGVESGVVSAYALLAVAWTWPYAPNAATALPNGINPTSLPASAGAWALWWVADRARHGFVGLWDAPIFHPAHDAFGYSEPSLPLGLLVAPLIWAGAPIGVAYAVVVLGSLVGNGLAGRWLAKLLGAGEVAAVAAGAWLLTASLPWKWLAVMPLVPLFPMLLFVGACLVAARTADVRWGAAAGVAFALTWATCLQYGFFVTLAAPPLLLLARPERRHLRVVVATVVVATLLLAPLLIPQQLILRSGGMERSADRAEKGGAGTGMWLRAPVPPRLGIPAPIAGGEAPHGGMYPGTLLLAAAAAGVALRRRDREVLALSAVAALSVAWSALPTVELGEWRPYELVREVVPGLGRIREPRRAAALAIALFPVLASPALTRAGSRWPAVPALLVLVALLNERPPPMPVQPTPVIDAGWVALLGAEVPDTGAVLFLPFDDKSSPTPEVDRMIEQTAHGVRMVNGYSSYYPKHYWAIRRASTPQPQPRLWALLRDAGVTHLAARPGVLPADAPVEEVGRSGGRALYRLR